MNEQSLFDREPHTNFAFVMGEVPKVEEVDV